MQELRKLNPRVVTMVDFDCMFNSSNFLLRFKSALQFFWTCFDSFGLDSGPNKVGRQAFESSLLGREIMNVVSCDGAERVARSETLEEWQSRMHRAGFLIKPIGKDVINEPVLHQPSKPFHNELQVARKRGAYHSVYKGIRTLHATAWQPVQPTVTAVW